MPNRVPILSTPPARDRNQIDSWVAIAPDGVVTVFTGKVELGTGVRTALAQIAAEELDVSVTKIQMVMGDTDRTPDQGVTAGSTTIQIAGAELRRACAEGRRVLLELASRQLDAPLSELQVEDGTIWARGAPARSITYAALMGGLRFNQPISGTAPLKDPATYRVVGTAVRRVDIPPKVTGGENYIQDLSLPGMLHGRVVRPLSAGARLVSIDDASVADVPTLVRLVRRGSFVGVIAEREQDAARASQQLRVEWQEVAHLPAMSELGQYLQSLPAENKVLVDKGQVDEVLHDSPTTLQRTYLQPFQMHASIGSSCGVADVTAERAIIWSNTQGTFVLKGALAQLLEMDAGLVRVIHMEGAGAYGHNGSDDAAADAAVLSQAVGRPVRVHWTRQDEFVWEPKAPAMVMEVRGAVTDGNVTAWAGQVWSPTHSARPRNMNQLLAGQQIHDIQPGTSKSLVGGDRNAQTLYRFPNHRVVVHWLSGMPLRCSSTRSLGGGPNTFANESFIDELATTAGLDPLEFRLRHLDDPRAIEVLKQAATRARWQARPSPSASAAGEEEVRQGRGIAFARYELTAAYVATVAEVQVNVKSGEVRVPRIVVAHDCGLIVNPDGVRNQIEGNVIQSLSRALLEEVTFNEKRITSVDWESYPILKFTQVPEIEIVLIDRPAEPSLGAGEPATTTTAPAVANAIFDATGARVRQIPFTPKRVRRALEEMTQAREGNTD